jgi:hypothetical protein
MLARVCCMRAVHASMQWFTSGSQQHVCRCMRAHVCATYAAHTSQAMLPYRRVRRSQLLLEQRSYWQFAQPYQ